MSRVSTFIKTFAGPGISSVQASLTNREVRDHDGELLRMLEVRNGFFAFESALWVLPLDESIAVYNLEEWNFPGTWKSLYPGLWRADQYHIAFAMNAFGDQFVCSASGYGRFDTETGEMEYIGKTLDDWIHAVCEDAPYHLGFDLAHAWQAANGHLPSGSRLVPKKPFILGGEFEVDNLAAMDCYQSIKYRAELWRQLRGAVDGDSVQIVIKD